MAGCGSCSLAPRAVAVRYERHGGAPGRASLESRAVGRAGAAPGFPVVALSRAGAGAGLLAARAAESGTLPGTLGYRAGAARCRWRCGAGRAVDAVGLDRAAGRAS